MTKESWIECTLDELVSQQGLFSDGDWVEKKDQEIDGEVRLIQLADIGDGFFRDKSNKRVTHKWAIENNCSFLKTGDILIARMPDPLGRATIFPLEGEEKYITAVDVAILRTSNIYINQNYLLHLINSPSIRNQIDKLKSGTTRKRISRKNLNKIPIQIASPPEQRAIVAKIEELFSDLDKGVANLKKAQAQLKVYRQAVLKKAFDGELTKSKDLLNKTKLKKIVRFSQGIQVPKQDQKLNFQKGDVRFLRIIDFTQGKDSPRFIKNPGVKYIVSSDDISMVRYGASTGHICTGINGAIANNIFRIIPTIQLENKFLFYFFKSPYFLEILKKRVKGVAMPAISFGLLNDIEINFTSDERQQNLIVKAIESRLSVCDKVEESINESLEKSKALRQSILKKAFEGNLLSKDEIEKCKTAPDYEPAAVLLEKIKNL